MRLKEVITLVPGSEGWRGERMNAETKKLLSHTGDGDEDAK